MMMNIVVGVVNDVAEALCKETMRGGYLSCTKAIYERCLRF